MCECLGSKVKIRAFKFHKEHPIKPLIFFAAVIFIALNFSACSTIDKYLTLFLQSGIVSVENSASSSNDFTSTSLAKKADKQTSAMMNEIYKAVLSEVKECQSLNDKFGECAMAEYNNGKIYKILVYSKREVGIATRTLAENASSELDTGLLYCVVYDEECDKISFKDGLEQRQKFKSNEALNLMREYFEMDIGF